MLTKFVLIRNTVLYQWLKQNNQPSEITTLNLKTPASFYKAKQNSLFQQYFNIMWIHNQPIKQAKYSIEELIETKKTYYITEPPIKYKAKIFLPNLQRTRRRWLKYLTNQFYRSIDSFKRKDITLDYKVYYKYRRQYFSRYHQRKWFLSNLFYPTIGFKLSKVQLRAFKY